MISVTRDMRLVYVARVETDPSDVEALYWIGYCHFCGEGGVEKDFGEARRIWLSALTETWDDDSLDDKSGKLLYALGWHDQAVPRLQREADQGDSMSQYYLASCYDLGYGVLEHDCIQVATWFERSALLGNRDSQRHIAACYRDGHGVEQDLVKAVEWYDRAIAQHCHLSSSSKQNLLEHLETFELDRVLGCVQRNIWMKNVTTSLQSGRTVAVCILALARLSDSRNTWASLSPIFYCIKQVIPILPESRRKRIITS
jgi:Sel1 repeat